MSARDELAGVLAAHDDPAGWMWSDSDQMVYACECGDHYAAGPIDVIQEQDVRAAAAWHRAHVADALLASPQFARLIAAAKAEAWNEGRAKAVLAYHEGQECGCAGECFRPHVWENPYRAALPAEPVASEPEAGEGGDTRCPYVNTYMRETLPRMREDGWRCGESADVPHNHTLYSAEGERVLDTVGPWVTPPDATNPDAAT